MSITTCDCRAENTSTSTNRPKLSHYRCWAAGANQIEREKCSHGQFQTFVCWSFHECSREQLDVFKCAIRCGHYIYSSVHLRSPLAYVNFSCLQLLPQKFLHHRISAMVLITISRPNNDCNSPKYVKVSKKFRVQGSSYKNTPPYSRRAEL